MSGSLAVLTALAAFQAVPSSVETNPSTLELRVGETASVEATVFDRTGDRMRSDVRWLTADDHIAEVDGQGVVRALEPGTARIAVVAGPAVGFLEVTVRGYPVTSLETVDAPPARLLSGASAVWRLRGRTPDGEIVASPVLRYAVDDPSVAAVDPDGRIHGLREGGTDVRAVTLEGREEASLRIEVVEAPELQFRIVPAEGTTRVGDVVRLRVETDSEDIGFDPLWSVSGSGAQIAGEGREGVFVAEEPGRYRAVAWIGSGRAQTATVQVEPRRYDASVSVLGRGLITGHNTGDMWVFEGVDGRDYSYVGTFMYDWMKVFDVTDPTRPVLTDSLRFDARRINDIKIHPNARVGIATREMASNRRNGIMVLDLADPAHPTVASEYTETVTGGVHNVWIDGETDLVYAVHNGTNDVHIIDISDPRNPSEVGRWGLDRRRKTLHDVIVQDGYAYASYWRDGIVTLDVGAGTHGGTPTEPAFVSRLAYPVGNTHTAWRHGRYLFVGDENFPNDWDQTGSSPIDTRGFIHVIDMSDIENPVEVAKYDVPEAGAHNMWVEGDRLYIGYYQAGLRVVDISGELRGDLYRQGREVARLPMLTDQSRVPNWPMAWGAQLHKGLVFVLGQNSGIWITRLNEREVVF